MKTSTLLQLTSLFEGLTELAPVKKHLLRAGREVLMAAQGLLGFAEQYVSSDRSETSQQQMIESAIGFAQRTMAQISSKLPRGDEEEYQALRRKVMSSILEVLEKEIRKNTRLKSEKAEMKVEVLKAIQKVLLKEVYGEIL